MASKNKQPRELTDLEGVVLGFVSRRQPCTPYKIRQSFSKSTTTQFSASAGSIYPLVRRLEQRGLLVASDGPLDGRGSIQYRVSAAGKTAVRAWLNGLNDPSQVGIYDPIRSRITNLSLLSKKQQLVWLENMLNVLRQQQELIREYETQPFVGDHRLYEILRKSLWEENRSRTRWLRSALRQLQEDQDAA